MRCEIQYANDALAGNLDPKRLDGIANHVKVTDITWASLEALPGRSPGVYNWVKLDAIIESWRRAGYDVSCIVLRCQHWLATAPTYASIGGPLSSAPPKSARMWDAWGRLCGALAAHLRGLDIAIEIESEADRLWNGSVDEYLRLLALGGEAIRAADAGALVVLAGISPGSLLDDDPDDDEIGARVMALDEPQRSYIARSLDFYTRTLREGRYDVAEIHSLYGVGGIAPAVRRVRELGAKRVWIGDSFPSASLCWSAPGWNQPAKADMDARLLALERGDAKAREALYVEQVDTTHERILAAEAAGCEAIGVGPLMRWPMVTGQPWQSLLDDRGEPLPVCDVIAAAQP